MDTNNKLQSGFLKQVRAYQRAEDAEYSIYLVVAVGNRKKALIGLVKTANEQRRRGVKIPEIIIIDAAKQLSASKR